LPERPLAHSCEELILGAAAGFAVQGIRDEPPASAARHHDPPVGNERRALVVESRHGHRCERAPRLSGGIELLGDELDFLRSALATRIRPLALAERFGRMSTNR
jgi:hypothetical protein